MSRRRAWIRRVLRWPSWRVNTFVTTKISYANMIAEICENLPGADAGLVTAAVGLDTRIGAKYLRPGAPYGGPCFPRDNAALAALARSLGGRADIAEATDAINGRQVARFIALARSYAQPGGRVAILGTLLQTGHAGARRVIWCPPRFSVRFGRLRRRRVGPNVPARIMPPELERIQLTDLLAECLRTADIAIVATPWPELSELPSHVSGRTGQPIVVIDCWRLLDPLKTDRATVVIHPQRGPAGPEYASNER